MTFANLAGGAAVFRDANTLVYAALADPTYLGNELLLRLWFMLEAESDERLRKEKRVSQLRHLAETLDLLLDAFLTRRLSARAGPGTEVAAPRGASPTGRGGLTARRPARRSVSRYDLSGK